jgi:hypothetical protein
VTLNASALAIDTNQISSKVGTCRPIPGQRELVMQEDELAAVAWMPLEEYAAEPFQTSRPIWRQLVDCCVAYAKGEYSGMTGVKLGNGFNDRMDLLIHGDFSRKSSL